MTGALALLVAMLGAPSPPLNTDHLVVVITDGWDAPRGRLWRFERRGGGLEHQSALVAIGEPAPVVVGMAGLGWGRGLHPAGPAGPVKQEGDHRGVAGIFRLSRALGFADAPPPGTTLPYLMTTETLRCVDDPDAPDYARLVDPGGGPVSWKSAERLRDDGPYRWLIVVEHNTGATPVRGAGSCIFVHVWSKPGAPTVGCTGAAEADVVGLLTWLRPSARPLLVQLPRAVYESVRVKWGLPALPGR